MEGTAYCLETAAAVALLDGRAADGARQVGAADAIRERLEMPVWPMLREGRDLLTEALCAALGSDAYDEALAEGASHDPFSLLASTASTSTTA